MSMNKGAQTPLHSLLGELAHWSTADQDAILRALAPDQARALKSQLAQRADDRSADFASHIESLSRQPEVAAPAPSEAFGQLSAMDLAPMPAGLVATLLLNLTEYEQQSMEHAWSVERGQKVSALLSGVPKDALLRSSARLRQLLLDAQREHVGALDAPTSRGSAVAIPAHASRPAAMTSRIRSWLRV